MSLAQMVCVRDRGSDVRAPLPPPGGKTVAQGDHTGAPGGWRRCEMPGEAEQLQPRCARSVDYAGGSAEMRQPGLGVHRLQAVIRAEQWWLPRKPRVKERGKGALAR